MKIVMSVFFWQLYVVESDHASELAYASFSIDLYHSNHAHLERFVDGSACDNRNSLQMDEYYDTRSCPTSVGANKIMMGPIGRHFGKPECRKLMR